MFDGRRNKEQKKKRCSAHDEAAAFRVSRSAHLGGSGAHFGRRGNNRYATGWRNRPASQHETQATSSKDPDESALHRRVEPRSNGTLGIAAWRLCHARGHRGGRTFSKRIDGTRASGFVGGYTADSKHGDARWQFVPRYALQLLRSEL